MHSVIYTIVRKIKRSSQAKSATSTNLHTQFLRGRNLHLHHKSNSFFSFIPGSVGQTYLRDSLTIANSKLCSMTIQGLQRQSQRKSTRADSAPDTADNSRSVLHIECINTCLYRSSLSSSFFPLCFCSVSSLRESLYVTCIRQKCGGGK